MTSKGIFLPSHLSNVVLALVVILFIRNITLNIFVKAEPIKREIPSKPMSIGHKKTDYRSMQNTSNSSVTYHGGPVMHSSITYAIFWEPPTLPDGSPAKYSANYNSLLTRYFHDVGNSALYNNNTQYYDSHNGHILNSTVFGDSMQDTTNPYPTPSDCNDQKTPHDCLTDIDIRNEVLYAMSVKKGWSGGLNHIFFVYTSKGEGSCSDSNSTNCSFTNYCGYHSIITGKIPIIYAYIPYTGTDLTDCYIPASPNNDRASDSSISSTSHEHMETVTDPFGEVYPAWYNDSVGLEKGEIGDLCSQQFGPLTLDGGLADVQWGLDYYIVQEEWSNFPGNGQEHCTISETSSLLKGSIYICSDQNTEAYNTSDGSTRWSILGSCFGNPAGMYKNNVYINGYGESWQPINVTNGQPAHLYAPSSSYPPIIANGIIYYAYGSQQTGYKVDAYNVKTYLSIWSQTISVDGLSSSPVIVNGVLYIAGLGYIYAIDANSGVLLHQYPLPLGSTGIDSPLTVSNGIFYFEESDGPNNHYVYAFSLNTSQVLWSFQVPSYVFDQISVMNGVVYFSSWGDNSHGGYVYALYANDGAPIWPPFPTGLSTNSEVVLVGNVLYFGADGLYALNANTGTIKWHLYPAEYFYSPVVTNGVIFVSGGSNNGNNLYALNTNDGSVRFQIASYGGISSPLVSLMGY